jgi:hypothetical protein
MNPAQFSKPVNANPNSKFYTVLSVTPEGKLTITNEDYNAILDVVEPLYNDLIGNETEYPAMPEDFKKIEDQIIYALCILDKMEFMTTEDGKGIFLNDREKVDLNLNEFSNLVLSIYEIV